MDIIIPHFGANIEGGIILEWLKEEGDKVKVGDILFTLETDKAIFEVEAECEGRISKILIREGYHPCLTVVGQIEEED